MEIPYYKVAKEALIKWNGLTEGEADKVISEQTISEIEGQVYAKGSLEYAAEGMMRAIGFNKIDKKGEYKSELLDFIYKGTPSRIIDFISQPLHDSRPISKSQFDKDKAEHHKFVNEIIIVRNIIATIIANISFFNNEFFIFSSSKFIIII